MKRQRKSFILLVILLAVLLAGYMGLTWYNGRQQDRESDQEGEILVDIAREDILRFSYEHEGETFVFEREEAGGLWISAADPSLELKQSQLNTLANKLIHIEAQSVIVDVADMSQYGLNPPANVLHWETNQRSYTYYVGDYNSFGDVYYICEPDSDTVYVVTASLGTGFDYSMEELTEQEASEATEE